MASTARTSPNPPVPLVEVIIENELDAKATDRLRGLLRDALAMSPRRLVVDLSACPFVDAAAVDALVEAHRQVWRAGGLLTLRHPSARLRRLFALARVDHVFDIVPPGQPGPVAADIRTSPTPATSSTSATGRPPAGPPNPH